MKKVKLLEIFCALGLTLIMASIALENPKFFFQGIFLFFTSGALLIFRSSKRKLKNAATLRKLKQIPEQGFAELQSISTDFKDHREQFLFISKYYEVAVAFAYFNLTALNIGKPVSQLLQIPTDMIPKMLTFKEDDGNQIVMLFGVMQEKEGAETATSFEEMFDFIPVITDKILAVHSVINFINGFIQYGDKKQSKTQLIKSLQECLVSSVFLQQTFVFFNQKSKAIQADQKVLFDRMAIENQCNAYYERTKQEMDTAVRCCIDLDHLNQQTKLLKFKNYAWSAHRIDEILSLNGYPLPADVVKRKSIEILQSRS